jgi:hypothetical protein
MPQENLKKKGFFITSDTAHLDTIFKFLPHTRQHGCIDILIHTLASPSGRNLNYDEKQLSAKKNRVVPYICTGFVNTCPTVFLSQIFVIPEYIMKRPIYTSRAVVMICCTLTL